MKLKKTLLAGLAGLALGAATSARAFTYTNGDVLLIFRADSQPNVEFNLGNISQFLGHPNGYTNVVTNWNLNVVTSNYPLNGAGVQFAVLATTATTNATPTAWVSDGQPLVSVLDVTSSGWQNGFYSPISATGLGAANDPAAPPGTNFDVLSSSTHGAFDYIASDNGNTPAEIPYLGGTAANFKVTGTTPTTVLFYAIQSSAISPKPAATLIGNFSLSASGTLVFQAGPLLDATSITSVSAGGGKVPVTFNTKPAVKYRLLYTSTFPQQSQQLDAASGQHRGRRISPHVV